MEKERIRLVALDMDGTLLDSEKRLPPDFESWVKSHPEIITVIASGRQYYTLLRDFSSLKDHLSFIAENGALVVDDDKIIYTSPMKEEDILSVLSVVSRVKTAVPLLCGVDGAYYEEYVEEASKYCARYQQAESFCKLIKEKKIVKIAVYCRDDNVMEAASHFGEVPQSVAGVISGNCWVDFANKEADKGAALKALMNAKGIRYEEAMAFGDYLNDRTMLSSCYYSYAMGNAVDEIKKVAHFQTSTNDEDGVMRVLRKI